MFTALCSFAALLVGWATPQPFWAQTFTNWLAVKFNELRERFRSDAE